MKTKKQRKITKEQIKSIEKKLLQLRYRRAQIVKQTTPLKITLRKYIQQNMEVLEARGASKHSMLRWAIVKIKRGYFADANLKELWEIASILKRTKL